MVIDWVDFKGQGIRNKEQGARSKRKVKSAARLKLKVKSGFFGVYF
jgi:hypothetical protein